MENGVILNTYQPAGVETATMKLRCSQIHTGLFGRQNTMEKSIQESGLHCGMSTQPIPKNKKRFSVISSMAALIQPNFGISPRIIEMVSWIHIMNKG